MNKEVWIGLAGITPKSNDSILVEDKGGYVNILLLASSIDDYRIKVEKFLNDNNLNLLELDDIEELSKRIEQYEIEEKLIYLAEVVKKKGIPKFGTIHTFDEFEE